MLITGIGGTGVVTVSALLGMAAHIEGKGFGAIDMTGLAQKGGAVACHLRIAKSADDISAIRVGVGGADLEARISCDSQVDFLLDPEVQLVVLDGPAGSGKTRMMVATGLYMLIGQPTTWRVAPTSQPLSPDYGYDHGMLLLRPEHASSQYDLGYLPGDYESKLSPWLEPFFQAVRSLSLSNEHDFMEELRSTDRLTMVSTSMLRGLDIERSVSCESSTMKWMLA